MTTTGDLRGKLWKQAVAASTAQPQSLPVYQFVSNLNEVNNIGEKRLTALRIRTPTVVVFALVATAILAIRLHRLSLRLSGSRGRVGMAPISMLLACSSC